MEINVTDQNFAQIIASAPVVLIDFWAPWCGPCRTLSPIVEEIAKEYEGRTVVAKCNVDECEDVPVNMGIRSIPTLLYFKDGQLADRTTGALPKAAIAEKLNTLL